MPRSIDAMRSSLTGPFEYVRILFSYHYLRNDDIDEILAKHFQGVEVDLFADSGAFSAWTSGVTIEVDEYARWLLRWKHLVSAAATMDVIGDSQASYDKTMRLRDLVKDEVTIIPTVHVTSADSLQYLERYLAEGWDYLAMGGMVGFKDRRLLRRWVGECFDRRPEGVRYHGFGMTAWRILAEFPWYSVDSSTWTLGFRYAMVMLFDPRKNRMVQFDMRNGRDLLKHRDLLRLYGLPARRARADAYSRVELSSVLIRSWQAAERYLSKRHGQANMYLVSVAGTGNTGPVALEEAIHFKPEDTE